MYSVNGGRGGVDKPLRRSPHESSKNASVGIFCLFYNYHTNDLMVTLGLYEALQRRNSHHI